jgi:O-antigen/teichoic acid export membrane protein
MSATRAETTRKRSSAQIMVRDGLSLTAGAGVTSLVGVLAWVVAARLLPRDQVGQASAFVSGMLLVAGLGDLGLSMAVMRWVPRAGKYRSKLIKRCYCVVLAGATLAAAVVLLLPTGDEIKETLPEYGALIFSVACVTWAVFQFQDAVLVSVGKARWVPFENSGIGLARVGILLVAAPLLGAAGILLSWIGPSMIGVLVISVMIHRALRREDESTLRQDFATLPDRREVVRLLAPAYPAKVFGGFLTDLVPLLVIGAFGPAYGAVFFLVWMAGNTVDYAALSFAQSVIVRISHEPHRTNELFLIGCRKVALVFVPPLLIGIVFAHPLLSIFGAGYAHDGTTLLRLILLGCLPRLMTTLVVALGIAHGRGLLVGALEASSAVGVLAVVAMTPAGQGTLIGVGFLVVQVLVAAGGLITLFARRVHQRLPSMCGTKLRKPRPAPLPAGSLDLGPN